MFLKRKTTTHSENHRDSQVHSENYFVGGLQAKALFRCEIFLDFATVVFSFVWGKYCPIIN